MDAGVLLVNALGGGWSVSQLPTCPLSADGNVVAASAATT
jgi:hypothetical protein